MGGMYTVCICDKLTAVFHASLCLSATTDWKAFDCCAFFIELRQSAEGVDVLPDVPGDGGGGGDGSSGNNSDADDGGPAGLCLSPLH